MLKSRSPEPGMWKVNQRRWPGQTVKPTSSMLLEKYTRQQRQNVFQRLSSLKRGRSPGLVSPRARVERMDTKQLRTGPGMMMHHNWLGPGGGVISFRAGSFSLGIGIPAWTCKHPEERLIRIEGVLASGLVSPLGQASTQGHIDQDRGSGHQHRE
jgi:hypothetical protein